MCGCNGGGGGAGGAAASQQYEVKLPSGETFTVSSEHEARVAITRAGGGDFSKK
jgi:hypothetical protein